MAQQALPPGAVGRRAFFGMRDAVGWGWAGVKATFWFLTTIFLLGYIPNVVYYATVSDTVEVGANFISPINWCPASNKDLPCPAPVGAVVPWESSPDELALSDARAGAVAVQSGTHLYLVGGTAPDGSVIPGTLETATTLDGNFIPWFDGPALPEPRTEAAYASLAGVPFIIGGLDAAGNATTTAYIGILEDGALTGWALADGQEGRPDLTLPTPISGAAAATATNGLYLFGGRTADGVSNGVWRAVYPTVDAISVGGWEEMTDLALPAPRADAVAAIVGEHAYVIGGTDGERASRSVFRLDFAGAEPAVNEATGAAEGWQTLDGSAIPAPRARVASFVASGTIYLIGGVDGSGDPQFTTLWAIPNTAGDLSWHYLDQSNLTETRVDSSTALVGATAFVIGGEGPDGLVDSTFRANISPEPPFYRLGILGATLPGLSIKGEIGQQLGYINAMTVGMINFALLVAIGVAFSHQRQTLQLFEKVSRGRFKAPREDEFTPGT